MSPHTYCRNQQWEGRNDLHAPHELQVSSRCATAFRLRLESDHDSRNRRSSNIHPSAKISVAVPTAAYDPLATKEDVLFSFLLASLFIFGIRFVIRTSYEVRFNFICIPGAI